MEIDFPTEPTLAHSKKQTGAAGLTNSKKKAYANKL